MRIFNCFLRKFFGNNYIEKFNNYNLLSYIYNSYNNLFQFNINDLNKKNIGLHKVFKELFPFYFIENDIILEYVEYSVSNPFKSYYYCIKHGMTYFVALYVKFRLIESSNVVEENIHVVNIPMITPNATFIINGIEKTVISKFVRAPGLYLLTENKFNKIIYFIKLIPSKGYELKFFINFKNFLVLRVKKKEIFITTILKAFGYNNSEIINIFYNFEYIYFIDNLIKLKFDEKFFLNFNIPYDILDNNNNIIVNKNVNIGVDEIENIKNLNIKFIVIDKKYLLNKYLGCDLYFGKLKIASLNDFIDERLLSKILKSKIEEIKIIHFFSISHSSVSLTLNKNNISIFDSMKTLNEFFYYIGFSFLEKDLLNYKKNFFNKYLFYILSICRSRINFCFKNNKFLNSNYLNFEDFVDIIKLLISFKDGFVNCDDEQNLNNLNLHLAGDIIEKLIYDTFLNIKKNLYKKISFLKKKYLNNLKPSKFLNFISLNISLKNFFNVSEFCQFLDQTNVLSELAHKRRISFLGVLGISKKHSKFNVRELNSSHYSRLCPVETPEGIAIGLVSSLSLFCSVNKDMFLVSPYYKVVNNKIISKIKYLDVQNETSSIIAGGIDSIFNKKYFKNNDTLVRFNEQLLIVKPCLIDYVDITPYQILSISTSLIPFLEHNDSNRGLMAANMLRQALPCLFPKKPLIATGMEKLCISNSNIIIKSKFKGIVIHSDPKIIIIKKLINYKNYYYYDYDTYFMYNYRFSNQYTNISQYPIIKYGDDVLMGDNLNDSSCSDGGELAIGQNMLVAFMSWYGYNFEDSIIVSEKVIIDEKYTSLNIKQIDISIYDTNNGYEFFCNNYNNDKFYNLDSFGIICKGSYVHSGDLLIRKFTPLKKFNINNKIFFPILLKKEVKDYNENFYFLPNSIETAVVKEIEIFFSKDYPVDNNEIFNFLNFNFIKNKKKKFNFFIKKIKKKIKNFLLGKKIINLQYKFNDNIIHNKIKILGFENFFKISLYDINLRKIFENFKKKIIFFIKNYMFICDNLKNIKFLKKLPSNVIKIIRITLIIKKKLQVGDKMSGRHGNKGVVSKILPINDMPYMSNGKTIDVILNPLGVPSRMNIGQLLEVHLGWISIILGWKISDLLKKNNLLQLRELLSIIYNQELKLNQINLFSDLQIINLSNFLKNGVPFAISPFNNFKEEDINKFLNLIYEKGCMNDIELSNNKKQVYLYDGLTGKKFYRPVTVGVMYFLKLNHLAEDKIHARSTGPYSLVTQQPLKGKSNLGGQRLGEMEVWALEAYGAAYTLNEMLTIKSDDTLGRFNVYNNIINGNYRFVSNRPETFDVMMKNIFCLGMYIRFSEK